MLEAVLTRIILRYAQRYICDTLRTDSLSLWGGDLRVANFELRTEELARVLGTEESSIQLTRGFVRELRVVVPWNAIRSQSLRVEVDAVEIIFGSGSGGQPTAPPAASPVAPAKESSQEALDESQETWLQPLLRNIFGNVTVSIDNLVAKLERNGAVACVTVERLDSRPHSATWEAGFTPLPSLQPTLFRVVSVRDVTVTLDHLQQAPTDRKGRRKHHKALGRALRQGALPILHRVSAEVLLEWPWLPWSQPAPSPPTGRVGFYLSPVRARLAGDQVQILAQLLSPEVPLRPGSGGWSEGEADSESDRFSLLSGRETVQSHPSVSSRTRSSSGVPVEGKQPKVGRQATPDRPGSETSSAPATPSRAAGPAPSKTSLLHGTSAKSLPEDDTLQEEMSPLEGPREERRGGFRNFLSDVLFGDDDDEEEDAEERADADAEGSRAAQRETRRVVCCSGAAPLLALTLESASPAVEPSAHAPSSVIGTFALIGISAMAVAPAGVEEPLEGSFETHHIAIFVPRGSESSTALRWGTALGRSPLEVDDMPSPAVGSSPGTSIAGFTSGHPASGRRDSKSKLGSAAAIARAAAWIEVGRRLLVASAEFPAAASDALGIAGVVDNLSTSQKDSSIPAEEAETASNAAAVRIGFLSLPPEMLSGKEVPVPKAEESEEVVGASLLRVSVQIAEPVAQLTLSWLLSAQETLQPLLAPAAAPAVATPVPAPKSEPAGRTQAVVCFSGLRASLDDFGLCLGSARLEWREERAELDEAHLATQLRETTVFISSVLPHLPKAAHVDGAVFALDVSSASLVHCPGRRLAPPDPSHRAIAELDTLSILASFPTVTARSFASPAIFDLEVTLQRFALCGFAAAAISLRGLLDPGSPVPEASGIEDQAALRVEAVDLKATLRKVEHFLGDGREGGDEALATSRPSARPAPWCESSDSEAEEAHGAGAASARQLQLLTSLQHLRVVYEGRDGSPPLAIVARHDLGPCSSEVEQALGKVAVKAGGLSPLSAWSRELPDTALNFACQLAPSAAPSPSARRAAARLPGAAALAQALRTNDPFANVCVAFVSSFHVDLNPTWLRFALQLAQRLASPPSPAKSASTTPEARPAPSELPPSLALCAAQVVVLPSTVWLTASSGDPVACLTLPVLIAADPLMQADGLRLAVFSGRSTAALPSAQPASFLQPMSEHTATEVRRCLAQASSAPFKAAEHWLPRSGEEPDICIALARASTQFQRTETLRSSTGERLLVSLDVNSTVSPVQIMFQAHQLKSLMQWAAELESEPPPAELTSEEASQLRLCFVLRTTVAVKASFSVEAGLRLSDTEATAVLSLSLFEQQLQEAGGEPASPARCVIEDLLAPCTVRLCPAKTEGDATLPGRQISIEAVALDLGQRAELCLLLFSLEELLSAASSPPPAAPPAPEPAAPERSASGEPTEETVVFLNSVTLKIPGPDEEEPSVVSASGLHATLQTLSTGQQRQRLACARLGVSILDRHQVEAADLRVTSGGADTEVTVHEGLKAHLVTGRLFGDLDLLWPSAREVSPGKVKAKQQPEDAAQEGDMSTNGSESPGTTFRLLVTAFELRLCPSVRQTQRRLTLRGSGGSLVSKPKELLLCPPGLPATSSQRLEVAMEALAVDAQRDETLAPLLSPLSLDLSLVTTSPLPCRGLAVAAAPQTALSLNCSAMRWSAGAWQLGLLIDVASFRDPDKQPPKEEDPAMEKPHQSPAEANHRPQAEMQRLWLDLLLQGDDSAETPADTSPPESGAEGPMRLLVRRTPAPEEDASSWKAFQLPSDEKAICLELDLALAGSVRDVLVFRDRRDPITKASRLQPSLDYEVSGFDAAMGRWVPVSGELALGFAAGDGILARMAQASTRLRLQLRGLAREPERLLVELEALAASCAASSSEFTVAVSIPRLTWSVLNSGFALPPSPGGVLEEPFGDFSFFGVHLGVWQGAGQGLAVGARAESVGVDFYNMSTLSLVPLVVPEDNHMHVCVRMADDPRPRAVALRTSLERCGKMSVDVVFGRWRFAAPPWASARLAELGSLANLGDAPHGGAASARTPVLLRNGLPTCLVFGADGSEEVLSLPAGTQQSYIWCLCGDDDRRLTFGRDAKAPRSVALNLSDAAVSETGCNAWTSLTLPAAAESAPLWTICVSVRRVSCAQMEVELLPPMMLRSELGYALEFQLMGPGGCVEPDEEMSPGSSRPSSDTPLCSCNRILQERHFMKGLPSCDQMWAARETRFVTGSEIPAQLAANSLIGLLPPPGGHLRLRPVGAEEWAPELPLSDSPQALPFTTLLSFPEDAGISDTVLCVCHDLFGVPEEDARGGYPEGALQPPGSIGSAPQVLCLRPLLRFSHCCPGRMKLTALPLGTALADSGERQAVQSKGGDPRQLRYLELQVFPDGDESQEAGAFSSGPLLLGGLVQFPFNEADSLVSWRNSVRCSRGEAELHLLVELRRCRLSGLLRDVVAEPMWRVQNETGSDVLFGLAAGSGAECSRGLHPVTLHRATPGETWSTALGPLQHDPSFPLVVSFGAERGGSTSWTQVPATCSMGQTTLVELSDLSGSCFMLLVSVSARKSRSAAGQSSQGGVQISLFAGAYMRNASSLALELSVGVKEDLSSGAEINLPADSGGEYVPCAWLPSSAAVALLEGSLRSTSNEAQPKRALALRVRGTSDTTPPGPWGSPLQLDLASQASGSPGRGAPAGAAAVQRGKGAHPAGPALDGLASLFDASQRKSSGQLRDVPLELPTGDRKRVLLNAAYHVHQSRALILSLLPSVQPPLICANFSDRSVWISEAWQGANSTPRSFVRLAPKTTSELPCHLLRTLEVFPSTSIDGTAPSEAPCPEAIRSRLSLDPESSVEEEEENASWHVDVILGEESDKHWRIPCPRGIEELPPLHVSVRSASGVTRIEIRDDRPSCTSEKELGAAAVPAPRPRRGPLPAAMDLELQVDDLAAQIPGAGGAVAVQAVAVKLGYRSEVEEEEVLGCLGRPPARRQLFVLSAAKLKMSEVIAGQAEAASLRQVLAVPRLRLEACQYVPPDQPPGWESIRAELGDASQVSLDSSMQDVVDEPQVRVHLDDRLLELVQALAAEFSAEFAAGAADSCAEMSEKGSATPGEDQEFHYISLGELSLPAVPICADLRLSSPVFLSFTELSLTFPEIRLARVTTTSFVLGQELIAHCIAFLLLNSPVLLGSCDLFGNPVQAYRHLRSGLGDLLERPLSQGLGSLAWHTASASLLSVAAVCNSLWRNLPTSSAPQAATASSSSPPPERPALIAKLLRARQRLSPA